MERFVAILAPLSLGSRFQALIFNSDDEGQVSAILERPSLYVTKR